MSHFFPPPIVARISDNYYISANQLSYAAQVRVDQEIETWKPFCRTRVGLYHEKVAWWHRLRKKQPKVEDIDHCLHYKYHSLSEPRWPLLQNGEVGKAEYACMSCTNNCRACLIWDPTGEVVVVLPLAPDVRNAVQGLTERDVAYWVRATMGFTLQYSWARGLFEKGVSRKKGKKAGAAGADDGTVGEVEAEAEVEAVDGTAVAEMAGP